MVQVIRKCEKCGNEYNVDREDNTPLCHSCYLKANSGEGWYAVLQTGSGSIEVIAPVDKIRGVCHSGSNDVAVEDLWLMDMVQAQLQMYSDKCVEKEFDELGIDKEDRVFTRADMEQYLLWSLCWDFVDGGYIDETDEYMDFADVLRNMLSLNLVQAIIEQDVDCTYTFNVLKYESVGHDVVYMATDELLAEKGEDIEDVYELTVEDIVGKVEEGKIKIVYNNY